ncbi:hypothetical protein HF086_003460 [Spodoptera exigua]|uniref:N-acylneuraminate-9-phosphatase n=1 Tax=Spodoptera exigua TaxID=7107 RepID=A0A922MGR7_SPOEX|nr:hypothetical protein HF086_003460 [Spodoptera exigua]
MPLQVYWAGFERMLLINDLFFNSSVVAPRHEKQLEITKGWSINVDREDYLLGLITNGPSRAQWQKIERLGLRKYFDCLLVSGDLPWEKPDQHIFLEACKMLNVEPRMCIMVGDKLETDIKGGKEAELGGTVWIPLQKDMEASDLPDFTIDKVTELPEVLPNSPKLKRSEHTSNITCA